MTDRTLSLALSCLEPVSDKLVVIGGTAHRLFPLHELGKDPGFELLTTEDLDWAAPLELGHDGSTDLLDRLKAAGFKEVVQGVKEAAYTYRVEGDSQAYLQFIAPLKGSGTRRDGSSDRLLMFSGIHAEKLHHVDVLLHRPWTASLPSAGAAQTVQVVNPVAYLLQKLLILPARGPRCGKDLLYVFDTLAIFGDSLEELGAAARELAPTLSSNAVRKVRRAAQHIGFTETEISRAAATIAAAQRGRPPTSAQIVAACRLGLRAILGSVIPRL